MRMQLQALHTALSEPSFEAPMLNSMVAKRGAGSTFARADTADGSATVIDASGLVVPIKNGEFPVNGARRVQNFVTGSETYSGTNWYASGVTNVPGSVDPNGGVKATRVTSVSGNKYLYFNSTLYSAQNFVLTNSVWIKRISGTGIIKIMKPNADLSTDISSQVTTSWKRFYLPASVGYTNSIYNGIYVDTVGDVVGVYAFQTENVTGQSNQAPSEYVSTGVLSAPYHGANKDGVKYFSTVNANVVNNNVVTENVGTPIADSTLKGYLAEGSRINLLSYSEQFDTTAWSKRNSSVTGDKIVESNTNSYHHIEMTSSVTTTSGSTYTVSIIAKASERRFISVGYGSYTDGTKWVIATFDLSNGTVTKTGFGTGGAYTGSSIASVGGGGYRCSVTGSHTDTGSYILAAMSLSGTPAYGGFGVQSNTYQGDGTSGIYLRGAQLEAGRFASSHIPTLAAVTRGLSLLKETVSGNISNTLFTGQIEYTPTAVTTSYIWGSYVDANNYTLLLYSAGSFIFRKRIAETNYDATIAVTQTVGSKYKIAWKLSPTTGMDIFVNGTQGTGNANTTALPLGTYFYIGNDGNGVESAWGYLRNYKNHKVAKTDTYLKAVTA